MRRISCRYPYPVPCRVSRPTGVVWTCAESPSVCYGIPGVVGLGEVGSAGPGLGLILGLGVLAWFFFSKKR